MAFSPADIPSVDAWYDSTASYLITESGGEVSGWKNRITGNTPEPTQATVSRRPDINLRMGPNGLQCLNFVGTTAQFLKVLSSPIARLNPFEVWVSAQVDSNLGVTAQHLIDGDIVRCRFFINAAGNLELNNSTSLIGPAWPNDGLPHVVRAVSNTTNSSITLDNGTPVIGDAGTTGLEALVIGANRGNTFGLYGRIIDVVVSNAVLTAPQASDMWTFMSRATTLQGYRRNPFSDGANVPVLTGGMS